MTSNTTQDRTVKNDKELTIAERLLHAVIDSGVPKGDAKGQLIKAAQSVAKVTPQAVYQWYNKGATPTAELTALICRHLGFNVMWVLTGDAESGNCAINYDMSNIKNKNNDDLQVIDRLCEGIRNSGVVDVKTSLTKIGKESLNINSKTVSQWLKKETEPSLIQVANLCEFYGIAQRYVSLGLGPPMALDYISAVKNHSEQHQKEVISLKDMPLLGNV